MEDNKPALVINAIVDKANIEELPTYIGSVMEVITENGGKTLSRFKTVESLSGEGSPEMVSIIEFPSAESIRNMVNGAPFQALSDLRARVFSKLNMMISESM